MKIKVILTSLLVLGFLLSSNAIAEGNAKAEKKADKVTEKLTKKLNLTADQKSQVYEIALKNIEAKMSKKGCGCEKNKDKKDRKGKKKAFKKAMAKDLESVLTADQLEKFKEGYEKKDK